MILRIAVLASKKIFNYAKSTDLSKIELTITILASSLELNQKRHFCSYKIVMCLKSADLGKIGLKNDDFPVFP